MVHNVESAFSKEIYVTWGTCNAFTCLRTQVRKIGRVPPIYLGDIVKRSKEWSRGDQDGGVEGRGCLIYLYIYIYIYSPFCCCYKLRIIINIYIYINLVR